MSRELALQKMIANLCLGAPGAPEDAQAVRTFLEEHALTDADVAALLAGPQRLPLYRRLIRNNLEHVVGQMMPRVRARLGAAFDASFDAFLDELGPRTHHLRDVPAEFLAWVQPRWARDPDVPPWAFDLATHEHVEFLVGAAPFPDKAPKLDDVTLDRPLVFAEVHRIVHYAYAVHALPGELDDRTPPEARRTTLLVYRDDEHAVRFLELSPVAAAIVERLVGGSTLREAIAVACGEHGVAMDDALLADTARLLADLGERGVLLGATRLG